MKTRFRTLALLCAIFAVSTPLIADSLWDVVDEAEKMIAQKYPDKTSIAHKLAKKELEEIAFGDKTDEEKIAAIRATFPWAFVQAENVSTFNPAQLIFRPPLQWTIHSIAIAYDVDSATNILLSVESLYQEEDRKSSDESTGVSSATNFNAGAKTKLEFDVGGGIKQPEEDAWNPLNWFSVKAGYEWVTSGYVGMDYNRTKSSQWNERAQRALTNMFEEKAQILRNTKISNCHLTFAITFKNNTDLDLFLAPQSFSIPVYAGNELLTNAVPVTPSRELFEIPRNSENSDLIFRANLGTTSALKLIQYMRSHEPSIRMERGQTLISSEDGAIRNAVQRSVQVETVPFRCRDLELRIRKNNQGKATTVADAMRAVNAVFSSAPFEFNEAGACVSLTGIPLLSSGEKLTEHRLPLIGFNGSFTSAPIPASSLNRPLSDEGLTVDVWDITDSEMWNNASAQLHAYLLPHLKALAESGDAQAQFQLGVCYRVGYGVKKDMTEAIKWFRKAAEQGEAKAQYNLGLYYRTGEGVAQDYAEAVKWYRKAAEQGLAIAQCDLGWCFENGNGVRQDLSEAVSWYRKAAEQGDATAQINLGACYVKGLGTMKDYVESVKWFRKAAEQGEAKAQYNLGLCYYIGNGVMKDYVEAIKWFRKAAEQGDVRAQYQLGVCYATGEGIAQDYAEAVKWFRKAAEQGDVNAQCNLGLCYLNGNGVSLDYAEAVKWYRKAAEQGDADAQCQLGWCYAGGYGVPQNDSESIKWLRKATEQNNASAEYGLGLCYYHGKGVATNRSEAIKWFQMAADQGNEDARKILRHMLGYQ